MPVEQTTRSDSVEQAFAPGKTVYTDDGRQGVYVGQISDGPHLIKPMFEDYGYDGESVERWEGGVQEVARVFAEPPRAKLHEEVAALNSKVALLTQSVQALRQAEYDLNREQQKRERSEESRVGKGCVSTCRSRW